MNFKKFEWIINNIFLKVLKSWWNSKELLGKNIDDWKLNRWV